MSAFYIGLLVGGFVGTFAGIFIAALCAAADRSEGINYQDNSEFEALLGAARDELDHKKRVFSEQRNRWGNWGEWDG